MDYNIIYYLTSSLNQSLTLSAAFIVNAANPKIASMANREKDGWISTPLIILSTSKEFSI
jgi:hypothetical protein